MEAISFKEAIEITVNSIEPLPVEDITIGRLVGRVAAEDMFSLINSPSNDVSLKDGYAVKYEDIKMASAESPVYLRLKGSLMAGSSARMEIFCGHAVKVMSGAVIPPGTEAVIPNEFASDDGEIARVVNNSKPGQNILSTGTDTKIGELIVQEGTMLKPTQIGLIAAAGHSSLKSYITPHITIIATGDEVLAVGMPYQNGKVFASNLVTISAWCSFYGMPSDSVIVKDDEDAIKDVLLHYIHQSDCVITSGGAWTGERDLIIKILDSLGWKKIYHRVKMGPGKAIGFGLLETKPVFCLPGGPPSNQIAFLQLALPGLLKLGGHKNCSLPSVKAVLGETVKGQKDWTQFIFGTLSDENETLTFYPSTSSSRLQMMAMADGILCIPEGKEYLKQYERVNIQMLTGH